MTHQLRLAETRFIPSNAQTLPRPYRILAYGNKVGFAKSYKVDVKRRSRSTRPSLKWHLSLTANDRQFDTGVIVPKRPSISMFGPAVKYKVSEPDFAPPPSVNVHRPSIFNGLPFGLLS
jgi:hypothetical protein